MTGFIKFLSWSWLAPSLQKSWIRPWYVCMYVRIYVCTYVCTYVRTYVSTYICMSLYMPPQLYESEKEISIEEDESLIRAQEDELVARKYAAYPELHSDHHDNAVWLDNVPPQVLSKLSKSERDRQAIIYELVKTENQILVAIQILLIVFKKMFQEELKLPEEIVEQMFPHLEPLLALTQEFYYKLKQRLDEARNHVVDHIGDILLEHFTADEGYKVAKVYGAFCSRLRHALDVYQEQNKNKKFKKTVKLFANMQVCQGRSYPEFITLLAQRITEYPHLIAQLCKNTDSKHRDAKGLELALTHSVKVRYNGSAPFKLLIHRLIK